MAYSLDLRKRVLRAWDSGMDAESVAAKYEVSRAWVQRRFRLGGERSLEAIVEVFNVFNRESYGPNYVLTENNPRFGQPQFNNNVAFSPRSGQVGFRLTF